MPTTNPNNLPLRTPPWEHEPTTTSSSSTSATVEPTTTTTEQATTTTAGPEPITTSVATPIPGVDAVTLAPPVSYTAPTLPHTGADSTDLGGLGALLLAVGLITTATARRLA